MAQAKLSSTDDLLSLLVTTAIGVSGRRHVRLTDERTGRLDGSVSGGGRCLLLALGYRVCSPHARADYYYIYWVMPGFNAIRWSERNEASPKPAALAAAWAGTAALFVAAVHHGGGVGDDLRHGVLDRLLLPPRRRLRHTNAINQSSSN